MDHRIVALIAQWMKDSGMEPNRASSIKVANQLKVIFGRKAVELSADLLPYAGAAWQAYELYSFDLPDQSPGGVKGLLGT